MTKINLLHFVTVLTAIALSTLTAADTEVKEIELLGSAIGGEIVATFNGFGRDESGFIEKIPITIKNMSESTAYEFLFDRRVHQIAIQLRDNEVVLNDPFKDIEERMMGDTPLNLIKLAPGQTQLIDIELNEYVERAIYEKRDFVSILFNFTVPIYQVGADTTEDSSIEWMRVYMFPKSVPVVEY